MKMHLESLLDIEAIKALKAKYFRTVDSKDWDGLSSCFTHDLVADYGGWSGIRSKGRDNCIAQAKDVLKDAETIHHGHMPEIVLSGDGTATGIWSMEDIVKLPGLLIHGWGHYHENYRKENGVWKISSIKLIRLRLLKNGEETII